MNEKLLKDNYLYIPEFICPDRAIELSKNFLADSKKENFPGDGQAWNSNTCYNYTPSLELLCEKTEHISRIIESPVIPTYTYGRVYHNKSVLDKHTDRPACEISATVHLDGDHVWPIWIQTPDNKNICLTLNPGDAMIYLGCIAPHWRDEYFGSWYSQFFLHYVRSCGPCAPCYFDKYRPDDFEKNEMIDILYAESEGQLTIENNHENKCFVLNDDDLEAMESARKEHSIYKKELNFSGETLKMNETKNDSFDNLENIIKSIADQKKNNTKESPFVRLKESESEKPNNSNIKGKVQYKSLLQNIKEQSQPENLSQDRGASFKTKNLSEFILVLEDIIPDELCNDVIGEYANTDYWSSALTGGGHDPDSRRCSVISISQQEIININREHRLNMDGALYDCVAEALSEYENNYSGIDLEIQEDTGYELLRYETGDFYVQHTDHFKQQPRTLSCTMCLNDDYEGGEFAFFDREIKYKLKKGSILMFPSNFMYPHEVMPVTSGTRYSIITWLI